MLLMLLSGFAYSQSGTISGTVTEEASGSPVPGASVIINPGNHDVVSRNDGKYSIQLAAGNDSARYYFA